VLSRPLLSKDVVPPVRLFGALAVVAALTTLPLAFLETVLMEPRLWELRSVVITGSISGVSYFCYNVVGFVVLRTMPSASFAVVKEMRCMIVYLWTLVWVKRPLANGTLCAEGFFVTFLGIICYTTCGGEDVLGGGDVVTEALPVNGTQEEHQRLQQSATITSYDV